MNIEELKNSVNMEELKNIAINKYKHFDEISNKLNSLVGNVILKKKETLVGEFKQFFKENEFEVQKVNESKWEAIYQDKIVELQEEKNNLFSDEVFFSLCIKSEEVYTSIVIKAEDKYNYMLYWKRNLKYKDNYINFNDIENAIAEMNKKNDLERVINDLEENIIWYTTTINNFEEIPFVFSFYKSNKEFNNFRELFEAI